MKKRILPLIALLLTLFLLPACSEKELIPMEYTSDILIGTEAPDSTLVWAGIFATPASTDGLLSFSESMVFGIVDNHSIQTVSPREKGKYLAYSETYANDHLATLLGIKRERLREKFNLAIPKENAQIWEDTELFHFHIPEDNVYEVKPTEYAGKYVFIRYDKKEDKVYTRLLTPEEYRGENDLRTDSRGRVGDVCYFEYGYYDLESDTYRCYETAADLPPVPIESNLADKELLEHLKQNEILAPHLTDDFLYYADRSYRLGNHLYAVLVSGDRHYDTPSDGYASYAGSELLLVMLDADSHEVLYAERFHSRNYYMGHTLSSFETCLYRKGSDGLLYDLRVET